MTKNIVILIFIFFIYGCSFDKSSTIWEYNTKVENINYNATQDSSYEIFKENLINYSTNSEFPDINKIDE